MSLILLVLVPIAYVLLAKLLGVSVAASFFYSDTGKRLGGSVSRWCLPIFPVIYLLLIVAGARGNAGTGLLLFGSAEWMGLLCGLPLYAVPILCAYCGAVYIVRDLTLGHTQLPETKS